MAGADNLLALLKAGLSIGQTFQSGADTIRVLNARNTLQNLTTGQFAPSRLLTDPDTAERLRLRDAILKDLASEVATLLAKNVQSLTGKNYATLAELAEQGHPYAKKHFRDARGRFNPRLRSGSAGLPAPPYVINFQSGNLAASFETNVVRQGGSDYRILESNPLSYSGLLVTSTNTAIARPYDKEAVTETRRDAAPVIARHAAMLEAVGVNPADAKMPQIDFLLGTVKREYGG